MREEPLIGLLCAAVCGMMVAAWLAFRHSRKLRHAQYYLRRAKEEVTEILALSLSNPYPLIQITPQGEIVFINATANELFPGLGEQGLKHPLLNGFDAEGAIAREVTVEGRFYHQTIIPALAQGQQSFIVYSYDITAQKRYQEELKDARHAAERANQARGDFLANMSHELRTPMNGIIGLSDMLLEEKLQERHHQMIRAVSSSAHNLLVLLNDILDFSKIEAGELAIESIPFDPRQVVMQIASLQGMAARRKGLEMFDEVAESVPARLIGDPSRLQQVLNNLVNNAIKFTHDGSIALRLEGEEDGNGCFVMRLSVTDTGIGIPADKQEKVFAKFQQADSSTARKYGGTGLGLAITKELVELMGGTISIASEVGKGTTFTVTLSASIAQSIIEDGGTAEEAAPMRFNTSARILLVDDNPVNLMFLRLKLQALGFEQLTEATTGKEALERLVQQPCDLILMDGQMPEMDGFEASRHIRAMEGLEPRPVIVAVTADAMKGAAEKCKAAGMDDYISKPIEKEALYALLQHWLPASEKQEATPIPQENPIGEDNAAPEGANAPEVIDWERFRSFTDGNKKMEEEILDMFLANTSQDIRELERCLATADYEAWVGIVHKIFGSASLIGATAFSQLCDEAQYFMPDETNKIQEQHENILRSFRSVCDFIEMRNAA